MTTLAAVLVRQRSAPLETVEQAMLRQSLFGGDLATNLLELKSIEEQSLLKAVGAALECDPLEPGPISDIPTELRDVVSPALFAEHLCVPIGNNEQHVVFAVSSPLPQSVADELARQFKRPVVFRAALEIRVRQSLARVFGIALDLRTAKLLARLDGVPFESIAPIADETASPSSQVPTPRVSVGAAARMSLAPKKRDAAKGQPKGRRIGPFTAAMAEAELSGSISPGQIVEIWLDFASQYFEYTAIFAIQGDVAVGKLARGAGTTGEPFSRIGVPLDLPSALDRARCSGNWLLASLEPRGLDRSLARDLGRKPGPQVLLLPISVKHRVVLVTYGDHGEANVELEQVGDILALRPLVERHLERLVVERKRERSLAPPAERRANPAESGGASLPPSWSEPRLAETAAAQARNRTAETETAEAPSVIDSATPTRPSLTSDFPTAPSLPPVTREEYLKALRAQDPLTEPGLPVDGYQTNWVHRGAAEVAAPKTSGPDDSWDLIQPVLSIGEGSLPGDVRAPAQIPAASRPPSSPPGSVWPTASTRPGISPKLELISEVESDRTLLVQQQDASTQASLLPSFRTESHPALVPQRPSQSQEMVLPTVLVDYDKDCMELIRRWTLGDASALDQLVDLGDAAIGVLVRELPGPVTTPSRAPRGDQIVKASECGPILRALVAFGPAARPYVIARAADGDPKVRAWAVRLLGELGGRPSAAAVAQRVVLDKDAEVRRAAHVSCQLLYRDPDASQALRKALLETAFDRTAVITHRLAAIDALSDLRDVQAIPQLIELLSDGNPGAAAGAQQALVVLARQEFGYDVKSWNAWWTANAGRERIEWVIDALEHRQVSIRQAASEELRLMSRIYIGGEDDDTVEARARVQKKYRDWWASGGRLNSLAPKP